MYLYHILFTLINICGIDCQKNGGVHFIAKPFKETKIATRSYNITKKSL
jgi:predicted adenine nucleotide alpha hydrolase (AANH) superfamily ATPase